MATWIKVVAEVLLAFLALAGGSSFWSLVKLPKYFLEVMRTPSNLDMLQITQFTGVVEVDPAKEAAAGYPILLLTDVQSSLSAWRTTKFLTLIGSLVLMFLSYLLGVGYFVATLVAFFFAGLMEIQAAAQGNVFRDVQVMLGRIDRWTRSDPDACRKYCLETNPKFFREMYLAIEKRNL